MSFVYGSSGIGEPLYRGGLTPVEPELTHPGLGLVLYDPLAQAELEAHTAEPVELTLEYDSSPATASPVRTELIPVWAVGTFAIGVLIYLASERGYI